MEQLPLLLAHEREEASPTAPPVPAEHVAPGQNDHEPPTNVRRFDPAEMALRGRIGAYRLHATHDPRETTRKARERFLERFEWEVDPDGALPKDERSRRAEYARKAYFARLARARNAGHRHHRGHGSNGRRAA